MQGRAAGSGRLPDRQVWPGTLCPALPNSRLYCAWRFMLSVRRLGCADRPLRPGEEAREELADEGGRLRGSGGRPLGGGGSAGGAGRGGSCCVAGAAGPAPLAWGTWGWPSVMLSVAQGLAWALHCYQGATDSL